MDEAQPTTPKPAVVVPGYEIERELGRGGFAVVYLARQPVLNRTVALKVLTQIDPDDAESLRRFEAECQAIGSLSWHPHVVTVYDVGRTSDGRPCLAMENLPSGSLQTKLAEHGAAPWSEVLRVGVQIADALAAAHETGILHRDVKPANVLTDRLGEYRLADFGIARFGELSRTATGVLTGTIAYTAPDVLAGARHSVQSDLYSLGALLHCLVTGRTPFVRDGDESLVTVMFRATTEPAPNLAPHGVPPLMAAMVEGLMAKDPAQRPGSAIEVGQWFQRIQREQGLAVTPLRSAPHARPDTSAGATSASSRASRPTPATSPPSVGPSTPGPVVLPPPVPGPTTPGPTAPGPPTPGPAAPAFGPSYDATRGSGRRVRAPLPRPPSSSPGTGLDRRVLALVAAVAALVLLVIGAIALGGGDGGGGEADGPTTATPDTGEPTGSTVTVAPAGYDAEAREEWTRRCSAGGGGVSFCQCSFEEMATQIPFKEFQRASELFDTTLDQYPTDFQTVFEQCRADNGD